MWQKPAFFSAVATLAVGLATAACNRSTSPSPAANSPIPASGPAAQDDHSGWWCAEHGVPEEICALCNARLAAEYQRKGDWCREHNRPKSQCFLCDPKLAARYAAQYEGRFGTKPPEPPAPRP